MILSAEEMRDNAAAVVDALVGLRHFKLTRAIPAVDAVAEEPAPAPEAALFVTGTVSELRTETRGLFKAITLFDDLGDPPDSSWFLVEVNADQSEKTGALEGRLVDDPREAAELPTAEGSVFTVVYVQQGAPRGAR